MKALNDVQIQKGKPEPSQTQQLQQQSLEEVESRLSQLLGKSGVDWTEMAKLTLNVQQQQLYKQRGFSSFSAWVREMAGNNKRNPSLLWRFVKAAKYYLKLTGIEELEQVHEASQIPPEALEKLEKVQRQAPSPIFETLKERVLAGEATVAECRQVEKDYRPLGAEGRTNRGRPLKGQEGRVEYLGNWKETPAVSVVDKALALGNAEILADVDVIADVTTSIGSNSISTFTRSQVAPTIKRALKADYVWMEECAGMKYPPRNWETHQEVRVRGEGKRLRLDLIGVVRWSFKRPKDLFAVEIKSCLNDFESDTKWEEYLDFCNYFCFAIPLNDTLLLEAIKKAASQFTEVGILGIDFSATLDDSLVYPIKVIQYPQRQSGSKITAVYETLYERVLGWSASDSTDAEL
jgi:DNA repair protein MmcB-like